jgi:small subunit ribosomal protein S16
MSVRIRLRRVGRKAQPYYRVVVAESTTPRDGLYLDTVGFYNPRTRPAELRMDLGKVDAWVSKGAGMSTTVASLVRKARRGGDDSVALVTAETPAGRTATPAAPEAAPAAAPVAEPPAESAAETAVEAEPAEAPAAASAEASNAGSVEEESPAEVAEPAEEATVEPDKE